MARIPQAIQREVVRQQEAMGWPEMVPAYAECPDANGKILWRRYNELDVGICEQLVEWHTRRARLAIGRWMTTGSKATCRTSARHILYARLYRCRYVSLIGKEDSTEADMPFPNWELLPEST